MGHVSYWYFLGPNPAHINLIQGIINSQWLKKGSITVHKTGDILSSKFSQSLHLDALLQQHTIIFDGRIITFYRCHVSVVPCNINFGVARTWVQVVGILLGYLSSAWAMQALRYVGFVEEMEESQGVLPTEPEFRAKMLLDLSRPLIPGCFVTFIMIK